jgi:hypothetical protein
MKKILWTLFSISPFLFFSNTDSPDIIYWSEHSRLTWDDFQATPRFDYENISALTSSGIVHYTGCNSGEITYKVRAYFEKHESWVKEEALTTHHLTHEQIHFDITELYARKLRKLLNEQKFLCGQEVEFEQFIKNALDGWQHEQQNFDIITRHSLDADNQKEWFYKIEMELSLLDEFKE